jgi:flagellar hook protein FlgE
MLRSLFSAVSGLRSHQTMMDVVGNNIANVNTAGFKSSQTVFEDTLSQLVSGAGAPQGVNGGTNPAQVGLGARIGGIATNFAQGASQLTGRATDVAIQGDGFFVVKRGTETLYSRAGSFSFDATGNLTNPDGGIVQGWMANGGVINPNAPTTGLKLPIGQTLPPTQSANIELGGNLPSDAAVGTKIVSSITVYDAQGTAIPTSFVFDKTANDTWSVNATMPNANGSTPPATVGTATLNWNAATGKFGTSSMTLNPPPSVGTFAAGGVNVDLGTAQNSLTQFAAVNSVAALSQDGAAMGSLQSFTLGGDGTLIGVFSNGLKQPLGKVALANFNNPPGLEKVGGSLYRDTVNSGVANVGQPGANGRGQLASGTLEMSNVDLAQEFSNLIIAQRGFQANSRVITTSDQILQDVVDLKR